MSAKVASASFDSSPIAGFPRCAIENNVLWYEHKTDGSSFVPREHRVDSLGELGTAGLIDAAGVDPRPREPISTSQSATVCDFPVASAILLAIKEKVLVGDLFFAPAVRENGIFRYFGSQELFELQLFRADETHCVDKADRCN